MANTLTQSRSARTSGFTLLELLVVITVAAILIGVAVPSMQEFLRKNRMQGESQRLFTILKQARNNAIVTSTPSFVCRSTRAQLTVDSTGIACRTGGIAPRDWALDVLMYSALSDSTIPPPNNRFLNQRIQRLATFSGGNNTYRQEMLRTISEMSNNNVTVTANRTDFVIRFNPDGSLANDAPYRFGLCDNGDEPERYGRVIEISATGQIRIALMEASDDDRDCTPTINS